MSSPPPNSHVDEPEMNRLRKNYNHKVISFLSVKFGSDYHHFIKVNLNDDYIYWNIAKAKKEFESKGEEESYVMVSFKNHALWLLEKFKYS